MSHSARNTTEEGISKQSLMSSGDEGFVGEGGQLHEGHEEVASLSGPASTHEEEDDGSEEEPDGQESVQDDSLHTFTGHNGMRSGG